MSVTDDDPPGPALMVTINRTGVLEQTGANAATGTVTRYNFPLDQALVVTLASSDTTEATVPADRHHPGRAGVRPRSRSPPSTTPSPTARRR